MSRIDDIRARRVAAKEVSSLEHAPLSDVDYLLGRYDTLKAKTNNLVDAVRLSHGDCMICGDDSPVPQALAECEKDDDVAD